MVNTLGHGPKYRAALTPERPYDNIRIEHSLYRYLNTFLYNAVQVFHQPYEHASPPFIEILGGKNYRHNYRRMFKPCLFFSYTHAQSNYSLHVLAISLEANLLLHMTYKLVFRGRDKKLGRTGHRNKVITFPAIGTRGMTTLVIELYRGLLHWSWDHRGSSPQSNNHQDQHPGQRIIKDQTPSYRITEGQHPGHRITRDQHSGHRITRPLRFGQRITMHPGQRIAGD